MPRSCAPSRAGGDAVGTVASADHHEQAGWADAPPSCSSVRTEVWLRRFPFPTRGDHGGGAVVSALRIVLPRRGGTAGRTGYHRGPCDDLPVGATVHSAAARCGTPLPARPGRP